MGAPQGGLARGSAVVAAWTLASRVTGLVRVACVGAVLGPTFFANVYQSTNALPNVAYQFLTGSLFASLLVPPLLRSLDKRDAAGAERLAGGFLTVVLVAFVGAAVAVVAAGPLVMKLLGLGVDVPRVAAEQQRIGMLLLALVMPQLVFYGIAGTAGAAMNARGRFALPAAAPAFENVGIVATLAVFAAMGGSGREIGEVGSQEVFVLGAGTTASVGLHAAAQWWGAHAAGMRLRPRAAWRDPDVREVLLAARPALGHSSLAAVRTLGVFVVASGIPGGVVAFLLALNFYNLITALTARPIATVLLPRLARMHQAGDLLGLRAELDRSLSLVAFLTVPAAFCLLALAAPLSWALTFGEMATPRGEALVMVSLASISLGVLAEAAFIVLSATSYARAEPGVPFRAMLMRASLTLVGLAITLAFAEGAEVLLGLGLALVVGDICSVLLLSRQVLLPLPAGAGTLRPVVLRGLLVGAVMGAGGLVVGHATRAAVDGSTGDVLAGVGASGVAAGCFLLVHRLRRSSELMSVLRELGRSR